MDKNALISIGKLNVTYFPGRSNEVCALKDINLQIQPGEFIIFFGPSGCGKSTLLYSIAGLERNISGSIVVKGQDLAVMSERHLEGYHQRTIGMIFQSYYLIASLSVLENVALPQVGIRGKPAERSRKAMELLEKFGVKAQAHKLPTELSGGQQQRVAICRALMNAPDILVADEPVGNLDSKSSQDVMDLLRHLNDKEQKTVILVTHDPAHLHHAHRIFYMRDGVVTGTKTNSPEEREQPSVAPGGTTLSQSLLHWAHTYSGTEGKQAEDIANMIKAQQVLTEVFMGMSPEERQVVEEKIQSMLSKGLRGKRQLLSYLRKPIKEGGIGMSAVKADHIVQDTATVIREIRRVQSRTHHAGNDDTVPISALEARSVRRSLRDSLDVMLPTLDAVHAVDIAIRKRLEGSLDRFGVQKHLNAPLKNGGAGLSVLLARKLSRQLELLMPYSVPPPPPEHP